MNRLKTSFYGREASKVRANPTLLPHVNYIDATEQFFRLEVNGLECPLLAELLITTPWSRNLRPSIAGQCPL